MKKHIFITTIILCGSLQIAYAEPEANGDFLLEDPDKTVIIREEPVAPEVDVVSTNGALTRAPCPYTCEMRGLPKEHCRTWQSKLDPDKCYVWDTRLPQNAVPVG